MMFRRALTAAAATAALASTVLVAAPGASAQETRPAWKPSALENPHAGCRWSQEDSRITTELEGFPNRFVAGADWAEFTLRATNTSQQTLKEVGGKLHPSFSDSATFQPANEFVKVQRFDPTSGQWRTLTEQELPLGFNFAQDVEPGARAEVAMRMKIDAGAPAGTGWAFDSGDWTGQDGVCGFSAPVMTEHDFTVLPAGGAAAG
ncbi:hypothetical protein [Streptomyces sp. NPDC007100]|uniref:hypothetical protein n=1 Tax=unclassified Streptomyces TaxID=2593676 RepID=UPI0033CC35B8